MHIGIFDSGIGGQAIAHAIRAHFPSARFTVVNDKVHVPYGDKPPEQIRRLTENALQPLLTASCDIIVIACNTATAVAIDYLRQTYPHQRFIGLEPMVKPASELTKTRTITVCATPATLASKSYQALKNRYGKDLSVYEPNCSRWAYMIEHNVLDKKELKRVIDDSNARHADVIVLGCTHYHWIQEELQRLAGHDVKILEPSEAIARRIESLMGRTNP